MCMALSSRLFTSRQPGFTFFRFTIRRLGADAFSIRYCSAGSHLVSVQPDTRVQAQFATMEQGHGDADSESDYSDCFYDSEGMPYTLPGIHEALNGPTENEPTSGKERLRCPEAIISWSARPLTKTERAMIAMMGEITDKPGWERKVFDEDILKKWRSEAVSDIMNFSDTMFDFVSLA